MENTPKHLTDFMPRELHVYEHAVKTFGDPDFGISLESMHGHRGQHSLWTTRTGDCSDFWDQFDKSKQELGYEYAWES